MNSFLPVYFILCLDKATLTVFIIIYIYVYCLYVLSVQTCIQLSNVHIQEVKTFNLMATVFFLWVLIIK